jgi:uncharacterized protein with FMN-binding domain
VFSTLGLGAYLEHANGSGTSSVPFATATTSPTANGSATTSGSTASPASGSSTSTGLHDGTFTGSTFTNKWGNVQVQIVVANGTIANVAMVQYPDGEGKSVRISNAALPTLISETLRAQNAKVDSVSGASYTSTGYKQSLQSAIDRAHTAAGTA